MSIATNISKIWIKSLSFHPNCIWKCHLQISSHVVQASVCWCHFCCLHSDSWDRNALRNWIPSHYLCAIKPLSWRIIFAVLYLWRLRMIWIHIFKASLRDELLGRLQWPIMRPQGNVAILNYAQARRGPLVASRRVATWWINTSLRYFSEINLGLGKPDQSACSVTWWTRDKWVDVHSVLIIQGAEEGTQDWVDGEWGGKMYQGNMKPSRVPGLNNCTGLITMGNKKLPRGNTISSPRLPSKATGKLSSFVWFSLKLA